MPGRSDRPTGDPTDVRSIAVRTEDVVTALEVKLRSATSVTLRVTPPFAPRMRARLHRAGECETEAEAAGARPVTVDPAALVDTVPPYPEPDETEAELRASGSYSPQEHYDHHRAAVEAWRESVADRLVDEVTVETPDGPHRVDVKRLG